MGNHPADSAHAPWPLALTAVKLHTRVCQPINSQKEVFALKKRAPDNWGKVYFHLLEMRSFLALGLKGIYHCVFEEFI